MKNKLLIPFLLVVFIASIDTSLHAARPLSVMSDTYDTDDTVRPLRLHRLLRRLSDSTVENQDAIEAAVGRQIDRRKGINSCEPGTLDTPVFLAVREGLDGVVEGLVAAKADVNGQNAQGYTPLIVSHLVGRHDISELLVRSGASHHALAAWGLKTANIQAVLRAQALGGESAAVDMACYHFPR